MFEDRDITVDDVFPDHRIATHAEGKGAGRGTDAQSLDINADATHGILLLLLRKTGGNAAIKGDVHDLTTEFVERGYNLPGAGVPRTKPQASG